MTAWGSPFVALSLCGGVIIIDYMSDPPNGVIYVTILLQIVGKYLESSALCHVISCLLATKTIRRVVSYVRLI